jgi:hypothetical protein
MIKYFMLDGLCFKTNDRNAMSADQAVAELATAGCGGGTVTGISAKVIVRDGHGGGWSRKINARYLHTLMVYL